VRTGRLVDVRANQHSLPEVLRRMSSPVTEHSLVSRIYPAAAAAAAEILSTSSLVAFLMTVAAALHATLHRVCQSQSLAAAAASYRPTARIGELPSL